MVLKYVGAGLGAVGAGIGGLILGTVLAPLQPIIEAIGFPIKINHNFNMQKFSMQKISVFGNIINSALGFIVGLLISPLAPIACAYFSAEYFFNGISKGNWNNANISALINFKEMITSMSATLVFAAMILRAILKINIKEAISKHRTKRIHNEITKDVNKNESKNIEKPLKIVNVVENFPKTQIPLSPTNNSQLFGNINPNVEIPFSEIQVPVIQEYNDLLIKITLDTREEIKIAKIIGMINRVNTEIYIYPADIICLMRSKIHHKKNSMDCIANMDYIGTRGNIADKYHIDRMEMFDILENINTMSTKDVLISSELMNLANLMKPKINMCKSNINEVNMTNSWDFNEMDMVNSWIFNDMLMQQSHQIQHICHMPHICDMPQ